MRQKLLLLALLLAALASLRAQTTPAAPDPKPKTDRLELRRQSFAKVWETVNEKHYDETFGGVDWKKMREIYEPRAAAAKTDNEFYAVLRRMLGELKLSHFAVYPPAAPTPAAAAVQTADGIIGVEIRMIENQAVISRVEKNSSAAKAGLKTGFAILKVDEKTIEELLAPLEKSLSERAENENVRKVYRERTIAYYLEGKPASTVKIEALNANDEPQSFAVARYEAKREMSAAVGNFPAQEIVFEAKLLDGNVGYIRFNIWVVPQMPKIRRAIRDFAGAKGIVFDLRGNPGGIGGMAPGVAGLIMDKQASLGSMKSRVNEQKFIVYPQSDPFAGKIIILSDYATGSTSEVFAAGLQDLGRATVVGETSAGAVLPSIFDTLPTGAIFQYVISDYKSPKNVLIEGRGVVPDTQVKQTRASLLEGRDLLLETAINQILN